MNKKGYTVAELMFVVFVLAIVPALIFGVGAWTDRNLDFWLTHAKGHPVNVPFWLSTLVSVVCGPVTIAANIIAEVARFAI